MSVSSRGWVCSSRSSAGSSTATWPSTSSVLDAVLTALVQVDRARVRDLEHARGVDGADEPPVRLDELVLERRPAAQPDAGGRRATADPVHAAVAHPHEVVDHELPHRVVEAVAEPLLVLVGQWALVRRARDLRAGDERVRRVHDRGLGRTCEQLARMRHVPLVELVVARHEHRGGAPGAAPGPADLLAHRRERSREAVAHDGVERADVDPELERVRRDHAAELAGRELRLELASLVGEVAGAVRRDLRCLRARHHLVRACRGPARRPAPRCGGCA